MKTEQVCIEETDIYIEGQGAQTIVMVHGWPDTYRLWEAQVQALKDEYRCVRFTLPGFEGKGTRKAYTLDELTRFLKRVVEQVSPDQPVILLLHDWGCFFGYQFARRYPALVSRIIGVDVGDGNIQRELSPREGLITVAYQGWLALAWLLGGRVGTAMTQAMLRLMHVPAAAKDTSPGMNYPYFMFWFGGAQAYRRQARRFFPACPMLFIYGTRKPTKFHAQTWLDELQKRPGNEVIAFDTGHWVMLQQPERFNRVVRDWLAQEGAST